MKSKHKYPFFVFLFLCFFLCKDVTVDAENRDKNITLMVYMCGSNLESENGSATADLKEMLTSQYNTDEVNIIVMAGGSTKWWSGFSVKETGIYEITGNRPNQIASFGLMNMGEADTLKTLIDFSIEEYPASRYALIFWNHGGGPNNGVCWDSIARGEHLTMEEIEEVLKTSTFAKSPLEWIGFDACLMASLETANVLSPYARYMIASEEREPGQGWNYSFLKELEQDKDGGKTGRRIVEAYMENSQSEDTDLTMSCIDLSKIADLNQELNYFFEKLSLEIDENSFSKLSNMRQGSKGFGRANDVTQDYDLVDLVDMVEHFAEETKEDDSKLQKAIQDAVVFSLSNTEHSHGLSIYHPYYNKTKYKEEWKNVYHQFSSMNGYREYLEKFAEIWLDKQMSDWSDMIPETDETQKNGRMGY